MDVWIKKLKKNPIPILLKKGNVAIQYWVNKDLLGRRDLKLKKQIYELKDVKKILRRQKPSGYWQYPGGGNKYLRSKTNYNQLETYRQLGYLVEKYAFTNQDEAIIKAAHFLFKFQSKEGDFRGIYGNQYSPNYSAGIVELLIKAGYDNDQHIKKFFKWIISMRQNDGGWTIPMRTYPGTYQKFMQKRKALKPDRTKPHQHLATGVVLRAFAAHPKYRKTRIARDAALLLSERFFKSDKYPDRRTKDFWEKINFPYWYPDILSCLDSISLIGIGKNNESVSKALDWIIMKQRRDGTWKNILTAAGDLYRDLWVTLAVCRVLKRYYK